MTTTAVKQAVIEQVTTVIATKNISLAWLTDTLTKTLGIKKDKGKRVPLTKTQLLDSIEYKVKNVIEAMRHTATMKEVKDFVKNGGSVDFTDAIKNVTTTVTTDAPTQVEQKAKVCDMLQQLTLEQLWVFLADCTKWSSKEYYEKIVKKASSKRNTASSMGYTSCTDEEATQILASYYKNVENGAAITTPECFRGKRVANATNAFRRFIFSAVNKEECTVFNSVPKAVYEWYKQNNQNAISYEEAKQIVDDYHAKNPDFITKVKEWKNEKYITAVVKKNTTTDKVEKLKETIQAVVK